MTDVTVNLTPVPAVYTTFAEYVATGYWDDGYVVSYASPYTVTGDANVGVTGVSATASVGNVTVSADALVAVTGVSATGAVGTVTVAADANVSVTGVAATGAVGSVTVVAGAVVAVTGGTGTATAFTAGSIVFAGAAGVYSQDNANLFWDNTNKRLGVGVATPSYSIQSSGTIGAVGTGDARMLSNGDIYAVRSGGTTGVLYLNNAASRYLFFNGTNYVLANAELSVPAVELNQAGSAVTGAGQLYLAGLTSNRIDYNTNGAAAPAFTTRSAGTKITLFPQVSATTVDFGIGIEASYMWNSVPTNTSTQGFRWYGATTRIAQLSGDGRLNVNSAIEVNGTAAGGEALYVGGDANVTGYVFGDIIQGTTKMSVGYSGTSPNTFEVTGSFSRGAPVTKTGNFTLAGTENWVICNGAATITVTLPAASTCTGREVIFHNTTAFALNSATANVIPLLGGVAGTAILAATDGVWATLVSNGTNWVIMQA